jgi:UDP-N-acetylglucosamine--N-acetylmuramyl-(pentapeptide) pyrophosphoryl-undecaprenol N-acetylglucosamine transferase
MYQPAKKIRVAFAGGGSGGHLYPQIAVAREIIKANPAADIYFVSSRGSIEERLIPQNGFALELIPSGKLKGQGPIGLVKTLFSLVKSIFVCFWLILRKRPQLIFSAGGYAGAPFLVMGALMGVRCEILEQNRMPGLANRWMAKFCRKVYVNFAASKELFPGKSVDVVGHPCRPEIEAAAWGKDEFQTKVNANPFRIFVFGGSQGAQGINRLMTAAAPHLKGIEVEILHQTGESDYERVKSDYGAFKAVSVEKYIHDMATAFSLAHLVVCRAGASSLAELAAAAKASILIPLVSKDKHQEFNAKEMENEGAAITRLQGSLTGESLAALIRELYTDRSRLYSLAQKSGALHRPSAAKEIARSILAVTA